MKPIQDILHEQMSRKEFLIRVGVIIFILSGVSGTFDKLKDLKKASPPSRVNGFGGGAYGK